MGAKWRSYSVEGRLSTGPTQSSLHTDIAHQLLFQNKENEGGAYLFCQMMLLCRLEVVCTCTALSSV